MLIKENYGWIIKVGGTGKACGYSKDRESCIKQGIEEFNYKFVVDIEV